MDDSNHAGTPGTEARMARGYEKLRALAAQWSDRRIASIREVFSKPTLRSDRAGRQDLQQEQDSSRAEAQAPDQAEAQTPDEPPRQAPSEAAEPQTGDHTQAQRIPDDIAPQGIGAPVVSPAVDTRPTTPPLLQTANYIRSKPSKKADGQGLFPARHLQEGEVIFKEAPTLRCDYHKHAWGRTECDAVKEWEELDKGRRSDLRFHFPQLEDLPDKGLSYRERKLLIRFVKRYAFRTDAAAFQADGKKSKQALIYMKPGLMNHACINHSNCKFKVQNGRPYAITVELKKDVGAEEELLINYRQGTPYTCADCCNPLHLKLRQTRFSMRRGIGDLASKLRAIKKD